MECLRIGEAKLHWHGSSEARRAEFVAAVSRLPVTGFAVVHVDTGANDRRRRRKCMELLLRADILCGAVVQARIGNCSHLRVLGSAMEIHSI